jgi:LysM repeat protein
MALMEKYRDVLELAGQLPIEDLDIHEEGGKLFVLGTAPYQLEKDLVWDRVKKHEGWEGDLVCDLKVAATDVYGYYVVKPGDTLSKIAKECLDSAARYTDIFKANTDILDDPDKIKPGQRLKIPNK